MEYVVVQTEVCIIDQLDWLDEVPTYVFQVMYCDLRLQEHDGRGVVTDKMDEILHEHVLLHNNTVEIILQMDQNCVMVAIYECVMEVVNIVRVVAVYLVL